MKRTISHTACICIFMLILLAWNPASAGDEDPHVINVMILFTPAAAQWASDNFESIDNVINNAMAISQATFDDSEVNIELNLVHTAQIDYTESGDARIDIRRLSVFRDQNIFGSEFEGYMEEIHEWREFYGADLVTLFAVLTDVGGIAWILRYEEGQPEWGFSVIRIQQAANTITLAHEIGHNLGSHHSRSQLAEPAPPEGGLYDYSTGWRWTGSDDAGYISIMTYLADPSGNASYSRVPVFSNPNLLHMGVPTGSYDTDDPITGEYAPADNARGFNQIGHVITGYRSPVTHDRPVLHHDGGYRGVGIGLEEPAEITVASRYTPDELAEHYGKFITEIRFYLQHGGGKDVDVLIWEGGSGAGPGTLICDESAVADTRYLSWSRYTLSEPVILQPDTEYWIGYRIDATGGLPVAIDDGPLVVGKGGWINTGSGWTQLTDLDANVLVRAVLDDLTPVVPPAASIPNGFRLYQNYPNPFNPSTVIGFRLPVTGWVTLKMYNVLGEEVATLVNEELSVGNYEVTWDATGFASGVYYYRIQTNSFTKTKALIFIK